MEVKGTGNQEIRKSVEQENREFRNEDFRSFDPSAEFTLSVAERAQGRLFSLRTRHKLISAIASTSALLQFSIADFI